MAISTIAGIALGVGALGSAAISAGASKKAANAATQSADQSAQVQREQLQAAQTALSPYQQAGIPASNALTAFLGLPTQPGNVGQFAQPNAMTQYQPTRGGFAGLNDYMRYRNGPQPTAQPTATQPVPNRNALTDAQNGFRQFIENSDYGFRFKDGANDVNSGFAGAGVLKSGAAMRGIEELRQNLQSGYRGEYLDRLANQQALGMGAASALAGVGQNYAAGMTNINNTRADAIGNAALLNARNVNTMFNGLAGGILGR